MSPSKSFHQFLITTIFSADSFFLFFPPFFLLGYRDKCYEQNTTGQVLPKPTYPGYEVVQACVPTDPCPGRPWRGLPVLPEGELVCRAKGKFHDIGRLTQPCTYMCQLPFKALDFPSHRMEMQCGGRWKVSR